MEYAIDGGVFAAGAMLEWMCRELGMAENPAALTELARAAEDNGGARVLPGLAGLGAPWWRPDARAVLAGMHGGTTSASTSRAPRSRESRGEWPTWWRRCGRAVEVSSLRVDGGLTNEPLLLQLQADTSGVRVDAAGPTRPCSAPRRWPRLARA